MLANPFKQGGGNCLRIGLRVRAARQADRAETAAAGRNHRCGRGIEGPVVACLDPISKQGEDIRFGDGRGGKDAGAGCSARDFGNCEPFVAGQRMGRVKAEAAAADGLPMFAGWIPAAGKAVGEGEGE